MIKTGRQVWEEQILPFIDLTITVESVILDNDPDVEFTVCDLKWLVPGVSIFDGNSGVWNVIEVDYSTNKVVANRPNANEPLRKEKVFTMPAPQFKCGTPINVDGEWKLAEQAEVATVYPVIWLLESIKGRRFGKMSSQGRRFDFQFYCLTEADVVDSLNRDRHYDGVVPMTQLAEAVLQVAETGNPKAKLEETSDFTEFNLFGRETQSGFEQYILSRNLSGVGYRASINFVKSVCEC